jgi:3-phosphoshikimate 1-carboxyvinyltransferase
MKKIISPKSIFKTITAPGSKSVIQRAVALAVLSDGKTTLNFPAYSNDALAALNVAEKLGTKVERLKEKVIIEPNQQPVSDELNCGEAGLCIRMFSPVAALSGNKIKMDGEGSLRSRPLNSVAEALRSYGANCHSRQGFAPLYISGKLQGGTAEIDGSLSSQVLTGLLIALPKAQKNSEIIVKNLKSKPYIDLTLDMIKSFGADIENQNYEQFIIKGNQNYTAQNYDIEGDWSGASFLLVAGLIAGEITVKNLKLNSSQADKAILEAIKSAGGNINISDTEIITKQTENLQSFEFDATDCPDLFPPLVSLSAYCKGITTIKGVSRLPHKESNRGIVLQNEFAKIGVNIELKGDYMHITGGQVSGGQADSNNETL